MTVAASFGLASALQRRRARRRVRATRVGKPEDEARGDRGDVEHRAAPASFAVFGLPDVGARKTHFAIHIPWVMGIIGTRSLDEALPGINELVDEAAAAHRATGIVAYARAADAAGAIRQRHRRGDAFDANNVDDLGYALLLKREMADPAQRHAAPTSQRAAASTIPNVPVLFWSFRIDGRLRLLRSSRCSPGRSGSHRSARSRRQPLVSCESRCTACRCRGWRSELGWIVAEYGRQPWAIDGVLPTALGVSSVSAAQVATSLAGFVVFYTALAGRRRHADAQVHPARARRTGHVEHAPGRPCQDALPATPARGGTERDARLRDPAGRSGGC